MPAKFIATALLCALLFGCGGGNADEDPVRDVTQKCEAAAAAPPPCDRHITRQEVGGP